MKSSLSHTSRALSDNQIGRVFFTKMVPCRPFFLDATRPPSILRVRSRHETVARRRARVFLLNPRSLKRRRDDDIIISVFRVHVCERRTVVFGFVRILETSASIMSRRFLYLGNAIFIGDVRARPVTTQDNANNSPNYLQSLLSNGNALYSFSLYFSSFAACIYYTCRKITHILHYAIAKKLHDVESS